MDCISGAEMARDKGVTKATHQKRDSSWDQWLGFLQRIGLGHDTYLETLDGSGQIRICGAFMHAKRRGDFGRMPVKGDTARKALDHVAAAFVESNRPSPITDTRGKTHISIERQTRGYKREDPTTVHEKALPAIIFRHLLEHALTPRQKARANLVCGALFFACRSCEYSHVGNIDDRKTGPIRVKDIVFRIGNRVIPHDSKYLLHADSVSIDFGDQKSEIKNETVTQYANSDEGNLNPTLHWIFTILRLRSYPGFKEDWEVSTYFDGKKFSKISSKEILTDLRAAVDIIGPDILGFTSKDIGTHSVRSSFAMMAYLAKEPVYTIMLIGRWSSDAFLAYIEKQVKEFTKGVSTRMLLNNDTFYNVPLASETSHIHNNSSPTRHGRSHHRRDLFTNVYGRQGSLRHQLRPRN